MTWKIWRFFSRWRAKVDRRNPV